MLQAADRFWRFVEKKEENECWEWKGGKGKYGIFWYKGTSIGAHRFSWMLHNNEEIPDGFHVLHKCDYSLCVNPNHIFTGTPADNIKDMCDKNRQAKGQKCGAAKVSKEDVIKIRSLYEPRKYPLSKLADLFGISKSSVYSIVKRESWRHV